MEEEVNTLNIGDTINKNYRPICGDMFSTDSGLKSGHKLSHSLMIIENVYELHRKSSRINRNYNDQLFKHELWKKLTERREIIWNQHKNDLKLFPNKNDYFAKKYPDRSKASYTVYCYYNDSKRYGRLYNSKYEYPPSKKVQVITGTKIMLRISHGVCSCTGNYSGYSQATPLSALITKKAIYKGNLFKLVYNASQTTLL